MWPMNTRLKKISLASRNHAAITATTLAWDIPKTGILGGLMLTIIGHITGTPSQCNAMGLANVINRVRLIANAGINLIDVSGIGYHYLIRDFVEHNIDPVPQAAFGACAAGAYDLSMFFPISLNARDPLGLIMLQNEDTQLRLEVDINPLTSCAVNGLTGHTVDIQPTLDIFTVPLDKKDWPPFDFAHTWNEEQYTVAGAGQVDWQWPRGNIYAQVLHGLGLGVAGADGWTNYGLRVNQSEYLFDNPASFIERNTSRFRGIAKVAGAIPVDFLSESGLGNYGSGRDLLDSRQLTDITSVIQATGADTLYTIKRQLVPLRQG